MKELVKKNIKSDIVFLNCDACLGMTPHKVKKKGKVSCNFCENLTIYQNLLEHPLHKELTA